MKRTRMLVAVAVAVVGLTMAATPSHGSTGSPAHAFARTVAAHPAAVAHGLAAPVLTTDHDGPRSLPASCKYPPITKPVVTLVSTRTSAKAGQTFNLTGTVLANNCPLPGDTVGLYSNTASTGVFVLTATTTVASNGSYAFTSRTISRTTYFVTQALPGYGLLAGQSPVVGVTFVR